MDFCFTLVAPLLTYEAMENFQVDYLRKSEIITEIWKLF